MTIDNSKCNLKMTCVKIYLYQELLLNLPDYRSSKISEIFFWSSAGADSRQYKNEERI